MPKFSTRSKIKLQTCHKDLQTIFNEVIKHVDCSILEGVRTLERQKKLVAEKKSKTMKSNHLANLQGVSMAADVMVYPIDWNDKSRITLFAGKVLGIASMLYAQDKVTHKLRWGGDWDSDGDVKEHRFYDGPHFELYDDRKKL